MKNTELAEMRKEFNKLMLDIFKKNLKEKTFKLNARTKIENFIHKNQLLIDSKLNQLLKKHILFAFLTMAEKKSYIQIGLPAEDCIDLLRKKSLIF
jgi:hypothetical protein